MTSLGHRPALATVAKKMNTRRSGSEPRRPGGAPDATARGNSEWIRTAPVTPIRGGESEAASKCSRGRPRSGRLEHERALPSRERTTLRAAGASGPFEGHSSDVVPRSPQRQAEDPSQRASSAVPLQPGASRPRGGA